jgi:hypothetical protein
MRFHAWTLSVFVAIAATVGTQSTALSQGFKTPTHPTLSEIGAGPSTSRPSMAQSPFRTPTHPTLSEVGSTMSEMGAMSAVPMAAPSASLPITLAAQSSTGRTFFIHPPSLGRVNATEQQSYAPSTYEFTVMVPANAGQPLRAVKIVQETNLETVAFDLNRSKAFVGSHYAAGPEIPLASVGGGNANRGEATIVFAEPVQPGSTVTIALAAQANPGLGGVYQFGVTAYPVGDQAVGQFLGIGRLNLYGTSH